MNAEEQAFAHLTGLALEQGRFHVPANQDRRGFTIKVVDKVEDQDADAYVLAKGGELVGWYSGKALRHRQVDHLRPLSTLLEHAGAQEGVTCRCGRSYYQARIDWQSCLRCELEEDPVASRA